jgi:hypothetical protein
MSKKLLVQYAEDEYTPTVEGEQSTKWGIALRNKWRLSWVCL